MHPEIGATELLVIAAVALIVVGPKDLPLLLRKLGQFMGKLRGMANDFRASFDEMARQSELDELRAEVEAMRKGQLADMAALDAGGADLTDTMREIDDGLSDVRFPPQPVAEPEPAPMTIEQAKSAPKPRKSRAPTVQGGGGGDATPGKAKTPKPKAAAAKPAAKPRARKTGTVT